MANAVITWVFSLKGSEKNQYEQGRTFNEATNTWEFLGFLCVQGQRWEQYAWPGGYPLYYVTKDGGCLCSKCANENLELTLGDDPAWKIKQVDINYEDTTLYCDNCMEFVESAHGEKEDEE